MRPRVMPNQQKSEYEYVSIVFDTPDGPVAIGQICGHDEADVIRAIFDKAERADGIQARLDGQIQLSYADAEKIAALTDMIARKDAALKECINVLEAIDLSPYRQLREGEALKAAKEALL